MVIMTGVVTSPLMAVELPPTASPAEPMGAEQLVAAFLLGYNGQTRDAYRRDLASWFHFCSALDLSPLAAKRRHVDFYARHQSEVEGRSPATVARRLSAISGFYRYALAEEAVTRNPVVNVKRPKVGTDTVSTGLDKDELAALVRVLPSLTPCGPMPSYSSSASMGSGSPRSSGPMFMTWGQNGVTGCCLSRARAGRRPPPRWLLGQLRWSMRTWRSGISPPYSRPPQGTVGIALRRGERCAAWRAMRPRQRPTLFIPMTCGTPS